MMRGPRNAAGWVGLAVMLVLAGCGQADPQAALDVASVPAAEIYVDGVSRGMSPATIGLAVGEHQVELRLAKFESFQTQVLVTVNQTAKIDAALMPQDPSDPDVIAVLAAANGIDVAPFVAPELTRGRTGKRSAAVLLWPSHDVRTEGLVSFAIEADESYAGDASLEFRQGRKVLYRESFNPESVTTVRSLPATVVEAAKVNQKITWGLYYEDRRRPITADFRVVQRNKADKQLEKLASSRHVARQPEITQQILQATVLENNRLYTEALVMNLSIAANHPGSTQPYRGIVTTLRRLDAESSELYAFVAPNVSGRGGHSGLAPRASAAGLGIEAWAPVQAFLPVARPTAPAQATAKPEPTADGTPEATGGDAPTPGQAVAPQDAARQQLDVLTQEQSQAQAEYERSKEEAQDAVRIAGEAAAESAQAEAEVAAARQAVEASDATREQHEALSQAQAAAQDARQAADAAAQAARDAQTEARMREESLNQKVQAIEDLKRVLESSGSQPVQDPGLPVPAAEPTGRDQAQLQGAVEEAHERVATAQGAFEAAQAERDAAQEAYDASPGRDTKGALDGANAVVESARKDADQAQKDLTAAVAALSRIGNPDPASSK